MQRPNNAGGPGGGLWTTAEMGLGSSGSTMQHPAAHFSGRDGMQILRYPSINPQQPNPLHFRPSWGQPDSSTITQQTSASSLWNTTNSSGRSSDQTRSLLGTEQWGRESGGAPWGSTMEQPAVAGSPAAPREPDSAHVFRHRVSDPWLVNNNSGILQANQEKNKSPDEGRQQESAAEGDSPTEGKSHSPNDSPNLSETSIAEQGQKIETQVSPTSSEAPLEARASPEEEKNEQSAEPDGKPNEKSNSAKKEEGNGTGTNESDSGQVTSNTADPSPQTPPEAVSTSTESAVAGTIDQLQQMSLVDYQQTIAAAQLTSYQLAMQQQYAQQLAGPPSGLLFPGSYIIPAQANPAAYTDPATATQIPVMAHYSPYAYAAAGVYPAAMLQQQLAAANAVTSQASSPPSARPAIEANRGAAPASQSPSQSPSLQQQQQDPSQSSQSELLANVAAMQQSQAQAQAMAMAGYGLMPQAYYDHSGALIITNNSRTSGPMRFFTPSTMLMNGSQTWIPPQMTGNNPVFRYNPAAQQGTANTMYAGQQSVSGGSTPVPSMNQSFNAPVLNSNFGSTGNISNLSIGPLGAGLGSNSSTPQRKDSFSDYGKVSHQQHYGNMSQFYNSLGVSSVSGSGMGLGPMSPSPGPLGNVMAHGHHGLNSPPPSMSPSNMMHGSGSRMFSAAPGAEAKYRNGQYMSSIGNSGSSLFPPTRISRPHMKEMIPQGRSKLLDDFRNNRLTNPMLHELTNHVVEFSQDQHGSRFIQQKLERASPSEKQQVFNEIIGSAYHLMTDVFGNYVIQKFFEFGSQEHKMALADCIHGHVLPLALQMYGCRVIQKALECIPPEKQVEIVRELDGHLLKCVKDQNGNHVVQKCIECVPPSHLQFIVDGFKGQVVTLSSHPYGCRVMQRILEHCTEDQTAPILDELHQHTEMLVQDQYGNYVIQHVLEHGHPEHKSQMINELRGKILAMSQHKFASNVIEKCVSHSSPQNRAWLIDEVCQEPDALFIMMKDQYANYVVQKMLDLAEPQQKKVLIHKIRPHVLALRKFTYGKHIITKLEKFFQKPTGVSPPGSGATAELPAPQHASASWGMEQND